MLFPPLDKRNTCDRAKGLRDHFGELYSESYIEDQSLMPRYGSRALGGKGHEGQNLSTFVWVLIHPWRWLAWASVIEKSLLQALLSGYRAAIPSHRAPPFR